MAGGNKTRPSTTKKYYYGAAVGIAALILIAFTVILTLVIIKWKRKETQRLKHQGEGTGWYKEVKPLNCDMTEV